MKKVTLQISDEFYEFAKLRGEDYGYFGPEDYLNGLLNTALLGNVDEYENGSLGLSARPCVAERDFFAALEEDPGGGVRLKSDGQNDDPDDDLPF